VIDAILFDLDGTLVDHRQAVLDVVVELIAAFPDAQAPPSALRETWWTLERKHMERYLSGECSFVEQRRQRLTEFLPLLGEDVPGNDAGLDGLFAGNYRGAYETVWRCYPDVEGRVQDLCEVEVWR
jgi:putative hydrolase of the HAD superfamily